MIQEGSEFTYLIRDAKLQMPVRFCILESAMAVFRPAMHFDHPVPPFNRIFLFRTGGCRIHLESGERRLAARRIYLLPQKLSFSVDYRSGSELRAFHIQVQDIAGLDVFRFADTILEMPDAAASVRELLATFPGEGQQRVRWQSTLMQIACRLGAPYFERLQPQMGQAARYRELLEHVRRTCSATLTVADLAKRFGCSRASLSKGFQRSLGVPLKTHLQTVLLQRAKERLAGSNQKVCDLALDLGFEEVYYFYRFFKRHMRQTPLEYRRRMALNEH
jgi:AraC-like DNA-binding protein